MAWSESRVFRQFFDTLLAGTPFDLDTDTLKAALWDDTITPSHNVSAANSAFGAGVWASGEKFDGSNWRTGGEQITGVSVAGSAATTTVDADNTPSNTSSATMEEIHGVLVYDDTLTSPVADQGICYLYLGGANSVTSGTFTVVWSASGIMSITV